MQMRCKSFRYIFCLAFLCSLLFSTRFNCTASGSLIKVYLPRNVEIDIPNNWMMLSDGLAYSIDSSAESIELSSEKSDLAFAANCYNGDEITIGILNVRYYPDHQVSYSDACGYTDDDIKELDALIEITANLSANGPEIVSWVGTKKSDINGFVAFVTEYRRKSAVGAGIFRVRLVRFLAAERSFTLTISYLESESASLESVSDQIINSISLSKFDMLSVTNKEQGDISSIQELLSLFYGDRWLVRIILSFIITWSIGLVPPLLIRYLICGKPIKSIGLAIGVVTILYVANVVIFTLKMLVQIRQPLPALI